MFVDVDMDRIGPALKEAGRALDVVGEIAVIGIARSRADPEERQVYGLATEAGEYVMKFDRTAQRSGLLRREFATLERLWEHFGERSAPGVIPPVYLSPGGTFHLTRFVDAPSAQSLIETNPDPATLGAVFEAAGAWMHHAHGLDPEEEVPFWPNWHFKRLEELVTKGTRAPAPKVATYLSRLRRQAQALRGRMCVRRFAHGDLHGDNLLIAADGAVGFDLTESRMKLPIYDAVDLLRLDLHHGSDSRGYTGAGVSEAAWSGFFTGYQRSMDTEILAFCLRARALMDWVAITPSAYAGSQAQQRRFATLETRLGHALDG